MLRIVKPKNARSKRALEERDPKVIENVKTALFIRGNKTSETINNILNDLFLLKKPDAIKFSKKNDIHPFDDETSIEFLSKKNDASLIILANHSKKRPNNITFIRMFNYQIYDMMELGVERAKYMKDFKTATCGLGLKPCFLFNGEVFEQVEGYIKLKNMLLDFYQGKIVKQIDLAGLEHVITVTAGPPSLLDPNGLIHFRVYTIQLKKSGTKLPRVELTEMGPSIDFKIRRSRFANADLVKQALRVPKELKPKKVKNQAHDDFGHEYGRVHMEKQDFSKLQTRKMKGLKKSVSLPTGEFDIKEVVEEE